MTLEARIINIETREPALIAAIDHAIYESCEEGRAPPTLIYHNWNKGISMSHAQALTDINIPYAHEKGFQLVRMSTGGKAVVHFPDTEFTYSLFTPTSTSKNPLEVYSKNCQRIAFALQQFGLPAVVANNNDLFVGDKKVGGSALRQGHNVAMQQGIILYHTPRAKDMLAFMHPDLYDATAVHQLQRLLTGFASYCNATQEELRSAMTDQLLQDYTIKPGTLTREEKERANQLHQEYRNITDQPHATSKGLCWLPAPAYQKAKIREVAYV